MTPRETIPSGWDRSRESIPSNRSQPEHAAAQTRHHRTVRTPQPPRLGIDRPQHGTDSGQVSNPTDPTPCEPLNSENSQRHPRLGPIGTDSPTETYTRTHMHTLFALIHRKTGPIDPIGPHHAPSESHPMNTQHLITTTPECAPCPRCGRLQLTGHAEGLAYRADPAPLTMHAELDARLAGRRTWSLIADQLVFRDPIRIAGDHRGRPPVLGEHRCEHPPAGSDLEHTHIATVARLVAHTTPNPDQPPKVDDTEFNALTLFGRELGATVLDRTDEKAPF